MRWSAVVAASAAILTPVAMAGSPANAAITADPPGTVTVGTNKYGIALMPGAVVTSDSVEGGAGKLVRNALSGTGTPVVGPPQVITTTSTNNFAASANRVALYNKIFYGNAVQRTTNHRVFDLSGTRAAMLEGTGALPIRWLYDVRSGRQETPGQGGVGGPWAYGPVNLFGNYLTYTAGPGATKIWRRDQGTGKNVLVYTMPTGVEVRDVAIYGNLVAWLADCPDGVWPCAQVVRYRAVGSTGALGPIKYFGTRGASELKMSGTHIAMPIYATNKPDERPQLRVVTLGSHAVQTVGTMPKQSSGMDPAHDPRDGLVFANKFALDNNRVAWLDANQNAKVTALSSPANPLPRYLGNGIIPSYFTPNGDGQGDRFGASLPFSKQLTRCAVTFKRGTTAVRSVPCVVRNGDVYLSWDGKDSAGRRVPNGRYGWTVNALDTAGKAIWYSGVSTTIGSTVEVR